MLLNGSNIYSIMRVLNVAKHFFNARISGSTRVAKQHGPTCKAISDFLAQE